MIIKNFKLFTESLLDKLTGPSEEEVIKNIEYKDLEDQLEIFILNGYLKGILKIKKLFDDDIYGDGIEGFKNFKHLLSHTNLHISDILDFPDVLEFLDKQDIFNNYIIVSMIKESILKSKKISLNYLLNRYNKEAKDIFSDEKNEIYLINPILRKDFGLIEVLLNNDIFDFDPYKFFSSAIKYGGEEMGELFIKKYNSKESLLNKLTGPTEEEIDKKFNELVENDEEEKALNFAVKLKSVKYIIKTMKEFGVSANEVLEKVINSSNYDSLSFDNLLKSYDFIFNLDYEEVFNLFNKAHSSFKEVFIKYIKNESVLNGLLIDNAINNNNGTVGIIIRNTKDLDYNEALVKACEYGSDDVIKMLLGATSADIHYKNDEPLWYAIDNGKYSTIKILLENGANLYARNNQIIQTIKNYYSKTTKVYELLKSYDRKNLL